MLCVFLEDSGESRCSAYENPPRHIEMFEYPLFGGFNPDVELEEIRVQTITYTLKFILVLEYDEQIFYYRRMRDLRSS